MFTFLEEFFIRASNQGKIHPASIDLAASITYENNAPKVAQDLIGARTHLLGARTSRPH
jgi:hypothetical protein